MRVVCTLGHSSVRSMDDDNAVDEHAFNDIEYVCGWRSQRNAAAISIATCNLTMFDLYAFGISQRPY